MAKASREQIQRSAKPEIAIVDRRPLLAIAVGAIRTSQIHLHEAGRVPDLVDELR